MKKMYLGAQLYTVREYMKNEADFKETIKKIADIGYKYVQVSGIGAVSPAAIKEATEEYGLKVILTHTDPKRIRDNTEDVIADHNVFNCDNLGIGGMPYEHTEEGYLKFCKEFAPAIEKLKAAGKTLLYHNHRFEFEKYNGKYGIEILLENTDPDGLKLTFDTYWAVAAGIDVPAFMAKYADRILITHLKDMAVKNDKQVMTEMLTGNINFDAILKVCCETGIVWHFVEQDEVYMNAFDSMKISHDNLKAKFDLD